MILEDLEVSESIKVELVFQREELESHLEELNENNPDVKTVTDLIPKNSSLSWD